MVHDLPPVVLGMWSTGLWHTCAPPARVCCVVPMQFTRRKARYQRAVIREPVRVACAARFYMLSDLPRSLPQPFMLS